MQKWEYTFVDCEDKNNAWRPRYVNHQELEDWENGSTMIEFSNQLGEQGWELASSNLAMGFMWAEFKPLSIRMIFKRPKP
jgi:hypothetical protein